MLDEFSDYYAEFLDGTYDCVDRIVLNGYFRLGCSPGGFRTWWRRLKGSDDDLDNAHLMRMAGRLSRRVRAHAKAHQIPIIDCKRGERKYEIAIEHNPIHAVIGTIKKVGRRYKYYLTEFGRQVALMALKLREMVIIPELAHGLEAQA